MSLLRRGFKTEANDIAREIRQELGLASAAPLDPWRLADHLAIPVLPLSAFRQEAPNAARIFTRANLERDAFSAVTVFTASARVIVHNDAHSRGRQASNIAHELSHALLLHPPTPALDHRGCRNWDEELEEEATWLAGALLISEEAALLIARSGMALDAAAVRYGVSRQMLNVTGARARVHRARHH